MGKDNFFIFRYCFQNIGTRTLDCLYIIIFREIFEDWEYNNVYGFLQTKNKKWVNNSYNEQYRPEQKTRFDNLWIGLQ